MQRTRRFARRQERWFRRDPRIGWVDLVEDEGTAGDSTVLDELAGRLATGWRPPTSG